MLAPADAEKAVDLRLTHLRQLEAESIHILREVVAEFDNAGDALLDRQGLGGDGAPCPKAFHRGKLPFPLLHIDTTWKFKEMIALSRQVHVGQRLRPARPHQQAGPRRGHQPLRPRQRPSTRTIMKTQALLQALHDGGYDAAFGGARRDEEQSRAKERIYSFRDRYGQWDPKNQRPELWNLYNAKLNKGESIRAFPLSNWTELDIWLYIYLEKIPDRAALLRGRAPRGRARRHAGDGR
ncbi:MAG: sulfate adenylyltransferase subunit CysD [Polyangiaceae bacterium]